MFIKLDLANGFGRIGFGLSGWVKVKLVTDY